MGVSNWGGELTVVTSRPVSPAYWGVQFENFALLGTLPADAVIHGIYAVAVLGAAPNGAVATLGHGVGIIATSISNFGSGFPGFPGGNIPPGTEFYAPVSIGSSLSALSGEAIAISLRSSTATDFEPIAKLTATAVGYAIDYSSATPGVDTQLPAPFGLAAGHGLAWALPTTAWAGPASPGAVNGSAQVTKSGNTLVMSAAFSQPPVPDTPYILASTKSNPITVKIRGIKRSGDQKFTITAIDYDPRVYNIPAPSDLSVSLSGGSAGNSATTADPTYPTPATPPTDVLSPNDPGYNGSSVPNPAGNYILSPAAPLSQTNATTIALSAVTAVLQNETSLHYAARTFTITDPGSTPTWYYVTVADASLTGDAGGSPTLTAYCEASTAKVGASGYIYLGAVLATHAAGVHSAVAPGGWPLPFVVGAND